MKSIKLSLSALLLATLAIAQEQKSDLGVSANMAFTSNYIWRGMTQNKNSPALQGGFDLGYRGAYLGIWGSNVEFGDNRVSLEADIYGGYRGEFSGIGFDIGAIGYVYPNMSQEYNFAEAYIGLSKEWEQFGVRAKYSKGVKTNDFDPEDYYEAGGFIKLPYELLFDATYGSYHDIGDSYTLALSRAFDKFKLSLTYIDFNHDDDSELDEENIVGAISFNF